MFHMKHKSQNKGGQIEKNKNNSSVGVPGFYKLGVYRL